MKIFFLLFFNVIVAQSYSQQIFGEDSLCNGSVRTYWIDHQPNMSQIEWSFPQNGGSIFQWSPNSDSIQVQWLSNVPRIIKVKIYYNDATPMSLWTRSIELFSKPDPNIASNYSGGCGEIDIRKEGDVIQAIEENTFSSCQIVCEKTLVRYYAVSDLVGSSFVWTVSNPSISNITTYPNGDSIDVVYSQIGSVQIFLKETSAQGCEENITFCVEVIEIPEAKITTLIPTVNNTLEVCLNQTVAFLNSSIAYGNSPIVGNSWYFDDYSGNPILFSGQEDAQYLFDTDGNYLIILETVNNCGCKDLDTLRVVVNPAEGAIIDACICPKCENDTTFFNSPSTCSPYNWTIDGGSIIQGQGTKDIAVVWDNITPSGFATVFLECVPSNCPVPTAVSFPIITDQAEIEGATSICIDNESKFYEYKVPFWQGVSYTWSISPNMLYSDGLFGPIANQSPNKVNLEIFPTNTQTQYTIYVYYEHALISCTGTDTIVVDILPKFEIIGDAIICAGEENIWYANPRNVATNHIWSIDGLPVTSFTGDSLIYTLNAAGQYNIGLVNPAFCNLPILTVEALDIPTPPQNIIGETDICQHFAYNYSSSPTSSDYFIDWLIIDGGDTAYDQGSNISYRWTSNGPYIIEARQIYNNGSCPSNPVTIEAFAYAPSNPILHGPDTVCSNSLAAFYATNTDRYQYTEWELTGQNTSLGTIFNPQDTLIDLQFGNTNFNGYIPINLKFTAYICGFNYIVNKTIYIGPAPDPVVVISGSTCPEDFLTFTQTNTAITSGSYNWSFGDGMPNSSLENPMHSYLNGGTYFINLSIDNPNGCLQSVSATTSVNIYNKPIASASLWSGNNEYCLPVAANQISAVLIRSGQFNPSYTYHWADGPTLADIIPGTINQTTYTVINANPITTATILNYGIIAIDTNGCFDFDPVRISITDCPNCTDGSAVDINIGFERNCQTVQFRDTILPNPSYAISQVWKFNYHLYGSTAHDPTFTYPHSGMYRPSFEVTYYGLDALGNIDSSEICYRKKYLNVPVPMVVKFDTRFECNAAGNIEIEWINQTDFVALNNGEGTDITFTEWNITNQTGTNVYTGPTPPSTLVGGTYFVELTHYAHFVNNNYQGINLIDTCSYADSVFVPTPATALFEVDTNISCEDHALFFTDLSTPQNNINRWYWNFGDGNSSLVQNPVKSWKSNTTPYELKQISLTIQDDYGCSSQADLTISVYPNLLVGTISETTQCGEATIQFVEPNPLPRPYFPPYSYNWSTDTTTIYPVDWLISNQTGYYWLEIADQHGCTDYAGGIVVDIPHTPMAVINGPNSVCYGEQFSILGPGGENLSYQWFMNTGTQWNPAGVFQNLNNAYTNNYSIAGTTVKYKLLLTYTDPQSGISCTEYSEELAVQFLAKLPKPYIMLMGSSCQLPTELGLTDPSLLNDYTVLWSNGQSDVDAITANYYGFYQTTIIDFNACSNTANRTIDGPYPFYELPVGCYEVCDIDLPITLEVNEVFQNWEWLVNGSVYSSGNYLTNPNLLITNALAPLNTTVELVLRVKELINGEYCIHSSDTIFLTLEKCPVIIPCIFEPFVNINDTSFCEGEEVYLDVTWGGFNYMGGFSYYLDNVLVFSRFYNTPDFIGLLGTSELLVQTELSDSAALGIHTYCLILAEDSLMNCVDTVCFSFAVNSCTSGCDSLNLAPNITYSIDSGYLNVTDVSTGFYEIVDISYNGQNYTGLPNSSTQFPILDYGLISDLCITIVAFIGDECCKQSICLPIEINCDELNLQSNFTHSNAFNTYDFTYTGNQTPTVLLWTFPDGTQVTGNVQNNPNILNPSWYDQQRNGGEVCLKPIIHLNDSICCTADTCFRLAQNPLSPCEQLASFTDFSVAFTDHTDFYSVLFTPIVSNKGNFVFDKNYWIIDGMDYYTWATTEKFICKEEAYFIEACLYMFYYNPKTDRYCEYKVCKEVEIPPCSHFSFRPMLYPNPINDKFIIDMQKMSLENSSFEIFDVTGKLLETRKILNTKTQVDLEKWNTGVYKVIINNKEEKFIENIIKN